jgi:hypothetical protein
MSTRRKPGSGDPRRRQYEWPMVTIVHPDHGSYLLHVHGTRKRGTDALTLTVFGNGANSVQQCDVVFACAEGTDSDVVHLDRADITEDLSIFLAAKIHDDPSTGVLVVPGSEWGLNGAGRPVARR